LNSHLARKNVINFNIKDSKLIIDAETLTVSAFNDIWMFDTTKTKNKASNMLVYVYHMCDIRKENPFRDLPYHQKNEMSRRNAFGNKDYKFSEKEKQLIDRALAWYEVLNKSSVLRISMSIDKKLDQISEYLDQKEIKTDEDLEAQAKVMAQIDKVLTSKKRTDEFVINELEKSKIKAGSELSPLAKGLLD
jgi:hypothetical protein